MTTVNIDTARVISGPVQVLVDTLREINPNTVVNIDTRRQLSGPISVDVDTSRRLTVPPVNFEVLSINLKSGTLADSYSMTSLVGASLDTAYAGTLYGWPWGFTVRGKSYKPATKRMELNGDYDISEKLKKWITFATATTDATNVINMMAAQLGKTASVNIDTHGVRRMSEQSTVMQILSSLFGWTLAIPHQFVNVFQRGNVLYVVQRGKETETYTPVKYNVTDISEKRVDTLMDEALWTPEIVGDPDGTFYSGTMSFNGADITYENGYVTETDANGQITRFGYSDDDPNDPDSDDRYLVEKSVSEAGRNTVVTLYEYASYKGSLYLAAEAELETGDVKIYVAGALVAQRLGVVFSRTITSHWPLGNGFYSSYSVKQTITYSTVVTGVPGSYTYSISAVEGDFIPVGSSISEGRPGGKATARERSADENTPKVAISHNPIASNHIPVTDVTTLTRYKNGLEWLDGKTEYRMQLDCYDEHIVDFDKTVTVNSLVWYLDSNQITIDGKTAKAKQSLELVRWA